MLIWINQKKRLEIAENRVFHLMENDTSLKPGIYNIYMRIGKPFIIFAKNASKVEITNFINGLALFFVPNKDIDALCGPLLKKAMRFVLSKEEQDKIVEKFSAEQKTFMNNYGGVTLTKDNLKEQRATLDRMVLDAKDVAQLELDSFIKHFETLEKLNKIYEVDFYSTWEVNEVAVLIHFLMEVNHFPRKPLDTKIQNHLTSLGIKKEISARNISNAIRAARKERLNSKYFFKAFQHITEKYPQYKKLIETEYQHILKNDLED
jgi:hypothetical protein